MGEMKYVHACVSEWTDGCVWGEGGGRVGRGTDRELRSRRQWNIGIGQTGQRATINLHDLFI